MLAALGLYGIPELSARAQENSPELARPAHVATEHVDGASANVRAAGRIVDIYREAGGETEGAADKAHDARPEWVEEALALSIAHVDRDDVKGPHKLSHAGQQLRLHSAMRDDLGQTHLRLAQLHDGVEVVGGQLVSHLERGPEPEVGGRIFDVSDVDPTPTLDAGQAIEAATAAHELTGRLAAEPEATLVVLPHEVFDYKADGQATLCWRVTLLVEDQVEASGTFEYYVDARDGSVVWRHAADQHGSGASLYSGTVPVGSRPNGSTYLMVDTARVNSQVFDVQGATSGAGVQMTDTDDWWGDGTVNNRQTAAVSVQFGVAKTWDYFAGAYGWRGLNGSGYAVTSKVHWGGSTGAQYNPTTNDLWFGDGDWQTLPSVSLDVVGHEFTHGVTRFTAGLIYQNESGAINESFSDIFGTAVEWYVGNVGARPPDYLLFEDTYGRVAGRDASRDMANPMRLSYTSPSGTVHCREYYGDLYTGTWDNGGVHVNSGIMNNAFYLLAVGGMNGSTGLQVPAIGRTSAERIFFRALHTYLFPSAQFYDARVATVNAAVDLFGAASDEANAVEKAWEAVGVTGPNLFFYNASNGSGATGRITWEGTFFQQAGYGAGSFSPNWTDIVPTRHGLFYYNRQTGAYAVTRTNFYGGVTTLSGGYLPNNASHVVSADNGVLLYKSVDRSGRILQVWQDGRVVTTDEFLPGELGAWDSIVNTPGGLLFYNYTGTIAVGRIITGFLYTTDHRINFVGSNFMTVMPIGGQVLFYSSTTGVFALGTVDANGRYSGVNTSICSDGLGPGYDRIVKHGADVFFYNRGTGAALVVRQTFCGLRVVRAYPAYSANSFSPLWSHLVSTTNGLFFYDERTGRAAVGGFNADGSFYQTASYPAGWFGPWWSKVIRLTK